MLSYAIFWLHFFPRLLLPAGKSSLFCKGCKTISILDELSSVVEFPCTLGLRSEELARSREVSFHVIDHGVIEKWVWFNDGGCQALDFGGVRAGSAAGRECFPLGRSPSPCGPCALGLLGRQAHGLVHVSLGTLNLACIELCLAMRGLYMHVVHNTCVSVFWLFVFASVGFTAMQWYGGEAGEERALGRVVLYNIRSAEHPQYHQHRLGAPRSAAPYTAKL